MYCVVCKHCIVAVLFYLYCALSLLQCDVTLCINGSMLIHANYMLEIYKCVRTFDEYSWLLSSTRLQQQVIFSGVGLQCFFSGDAQERRSHAFSFQTVWILHGYAIRM